MNPIYKIVDKQSEKVLTKISYLPRKGERVSIEDVFYTVQEILYSIDKGVENPPIVIVYKDR